VDHGERPLRADEESSQSGPAAERGDRAEGRISPSRKDRGQPEQHGPDRREPGEAGPADDARSSRRTVEIQGTAGSGRGQPEAGQSCSSGAAHPAWTSTVWECVDIAMRSIRDRFEDDGVSSARPCAPPQTPEARATGKTPRCRSSRPTARMWRRPGGEEEMTRRVSGRSSPRTRRAAAAARSRSSARASGLRVGLMCRRQAAGPASPGSSPAD